MIDMLNSFIRNNEDLFEEFQNNIEPTTLQFYDEKGKIIINAASGHREASFNTMSDHIQTSNSSRFQFQENDIIIMLLGNIGVGKSSICQSLTGDFSFGVGNKNGTTIKPLACVIPNDNGNADGRGPRRRVVIDVPGLNQALVCDDRHLFVQDPGKKKRRKLETKDIDKVITSIACIMEVCLLVIDDKILAQFQETYDRVIKRLIKGIREAKLPKHKTVADADLYKFVKKRIIIVRNKIDRIDELFNPIEQIENEKRDIRNFLKLDDEPVVFVAAGAYLASQNQHHYSTEKCSQLKQAKYMQTRENLMEEIDKLIDHVQIDLKEERDGRNRQDEILRRINDQANTEIQNQVYSLKLSIRDLWQYFIFNLNRRFNIFKLRRKFQKNIDLHDHELILSRKRNTNHRYKCQICASKMDNDKVKYLWWVCPHCKDKKGNSEWMAHQRCVKIYEFEVCKEIQNAE
jgi:GTPase SAR1 family protein